MNPTIPFYNVLILENSLIRGTSAKPAFSLIRVGEAALNYVRSDNILLCSVIL